MPLAYVSDTPSKKQASVFLLSLIRIFDLRLRYSASAKSQTSLLLVSAYSYLCGVIRRFPQDSASDEVLSRLRTSGSFRRRWGGRAGGSLRLSRSTGSCGTVVLLSLRKLSAAGATVASEGPVQYRLLRSGLWRRMLRGPPARDRSVVAGGAAAAARTAYGDASCVALRGGVRAFGVAGRTTAPADACRRCAVNLFGWHPAVVGRWVVSPGVSALRVRSESFGSTARGRVRSLPHADS